MTADLGIVQANSRIIIGQSLRVIHELVHVHTRIPDDLPQQPFADVLSMMHGDDGRTAVRMAQEDMAPLLADDPKSERFEGAEDAQHGADSVAVDRPVGAVLALVLRAAIPGR